MIKVPAGLGSRFRSGYAALSVQERMGDEKIKIETPTTVERLARDHGVPPVLLAAANGLELGETVRPGKTIALPLTPPEGEAFYFKDYQSRRRGGSAIAYRVRPGDNANTISRRTGMSVAQLRQYNPQVNWSKVRPGQKLKLYTDARPSRSKKSIARRSGKKGKQVAMKEKSSSKSKASKSHRTVVRKTKPKAK